MARYIVLIIIWVCFTLGCSKSDSGETPAIPEPEQPGGEVANQDDPTGKILLFEGFDTEMPSSFRVYDEDRRTQTVDPEHGSWISANGFAKSRAEHTPAGSVDNWLVTGGIAIAQESTILSWKMIAGAPEKKAEAYEIYVSETGQAVKDFQGLTPVFKNSSLRGQESPQVDLAKYKGKTVYIAFRHLSSDGISISLDYIKVIQKYGYNAALKQLDMKRYYNSGELIVVAATVINYGAQPLKSFEINYVAGQQRGTVKVTDLNILPMAAYSLTFPEQVSLAMGESREVCVTVKSEGDECLPDDTLRIRVASCKSVPKRLFGEKITQITCSNCGSYLYILDETEEQYPDQFIGAAIYYSDDLSKTSVEAQRKEYDRWIESWALGMGLPIGIINRVNRPLGVNFKTNFSAYYEKMVAPADLSVEFSFNADSSVLKATVEATFAANIKDDLRFGCVIIENGITGFGQTNAPKDRPVVHNHVSRALLGGINGVEGSVPANVTMDQVCRYEFTYNVPANFRKANLNVIGLLYQGDNGEVLNAAIARKSKK